MGKTPRPWHTCIPESRARDTGPGGFDLIVLHCESELPLASGRVASLVARFESRSGGSGRGERATDRRGNTYNLPCCLASSCRRKRIGRDEGERERENSERESEKERSERGRKRERTKGREGEDRREDQESGEGRKGERVCKRGTKVKGQRRVSGRIGEGGTWTGVVGSLENRGSHRKSYKQSQERWENRERSTITTTTITSSPSASRAKRINGERNACKQRSDVTCTCA